MGHFRYFNYIGEYFLIILSYFDWRTFGCNTVFLHWATFKWAKYPSASSTTSFLPCLWCGVKWFDQVKRPLLSVLLHVDSITGQSAPASRLWHKGVIEQPDVNSIKFKVAWRLDLKVSWTRTMCWCASQKNTLQEREKLRKHNMVSLLLGGVSLYMSTLS